MDFSKNKLYILLGLIAIVLIAIGGIITLSAGYFTISSVATSSDDVQVITHYTDSQIKEKALDVDYNDLIDYNEQYVGKIIHYKGQIIKINESTGYIYLTLATKKSSENYYNGNNINAWYKGDKLANGTIINVYGNYSGLKWAGEDSENETIPSIHALLIE
ncbi:hypothetical protein [Methanococcus voltae]|uniref:Archaeal Type IV pilin N-terminal domain-containing protein n=1 Tax=Methanococcus voltae PS TaxID=523842 RepID=A0ABT2EYY3_METVO|nr:hypothetical protein [Methanococcus voltae]MBP2172683.1 hypothetical protein [Methanococcus voltae]MCS3922195.1 hypothetical protein [Methanococcus voltae PS]